jgi:flagellar hook-basal body complex protein FliE
MEISKAADVYKMISSLGGPRGSQLGMESTDAAKAAASNPAFSELVKEGLRRGSSAGYTGEAQSVKSVADQAELHELVSAVTNAELTLNTVVAIRDKMIAAYQDIMKMPI